MGDILTVHDAAIRFGFSTKYIYAKIQAGELKSLRRQGTTFIDSDDLLPSPHATVQEDEMMDDVPSSSTSINETLEALSHQIDELKHSEHSRISEIPTDDHKMVEFLETLVKEQKQQISELQERPQVQPSDQEMLDYLREVITQQRQHISALQEKLERSQDEVITAIKDANDKKDDQLKQYIEFLNNSTKELITTLEHKEDPTTPKERHLSTYDRDHDVVDIDVEMPREPIPMSISDFLKTKELTKKERKHIKSTFLAASFKDHKRFITIDGRLHLYPYEYSYDTLLEHARKHKNKGKG